jgi:hypothetical protein
MDDFQKLYRSTYATLGYELSEKDCMSLPVIQDAEKRLGVVLPRALKDYYLVAGQETRFNTAYERLLPPAEWFIDDGKLAFMEENQVVVLWGVPAVTENLEDPPVYQGVNNDTIEWHKEHDRCNVFLTVMLHWQAVFGAAMPFGSEASAPEALGSELKRQWSFVGEVNGLSAYNRPGQVICHLKWEDEWRIFAGAVSKELMVSMAEELNLVWEMPPAEQYK